MQTDNWGEYSKLVLKELERLNDNYESMRLDMQEKFNQLTHRVSHFNAVEKNVTDQKLWIEKVTDVWSTTQMKEAKDEIYKQKSRWVAAIAIFIFIQTLLTFAITIWVKLK